MKHSLLGYWSSSLKKSAVIAAMVAGSALVANASLTLNITQVGLDVVATGSGSFDLDSLTLFSPSAGSNSGYLEASSFIPSAGSTSDTDWYLGYSVAGNPTNFGTGGGISADSSSTAGFFVLIPGYFGGDAALIEVANGYVSNTTFSVSSTWSNQTIQSLGLAPGTYTWEWSQNSDGSGARDSVTVNVVPEPSTYALLIAGLAFVVIGVRNRGRAAAQSLR